MFKELKKTVSKDLRNENNFSPMAELDNSTITVGAFSTSFSILDRTTRYKINKEIEDLTIINQLYLNNIYRTFYPTTAEHTLFKNTGNISLWIDEDRPSIRPKASPNKF